MSKPSNRPTRLATLLLACGLVLSALALADAPLSAMAQESAPAKVFSNYSGTGPGPTGVTEERTPQENERLYQSLKGYLMSPYCPGLTIGSCGSGAAEVLRADLREWVDMGYSREDIVHYYASTFGEEFLGRPPFRGSAIVVWVAPIAALLLGFVAVTVWIRRSAPAKDVAQGQSPAASSAGDDGIDPETEARLEAEVRARYS